MNVTYKNDNVYLNLNNNINKKKYIVMLVKMEGCGACNNFKSSWNILLSDPSFTENFNFITIDSKNDRFIIDTLTMYGSKLSKYNNTIIEYFPTLLIFKNDKESDYIFYEKFIYNRNTLKAYLNSLQSNL